MADALERIADALENKNATTWPEINFGQARVGNRIWDEHDNVIRTITNVEARRTNDTYGRSLVVVTYDDGSETNSYNDSLLGRREPAKP